LQRKLANVKEDKKSRTCMDCIIYIEKKWGILLDTVKKEKTSENALDL